jgi:hypothetical protein
VDLNTIVIWSENRGFVASGRMHASVLLENSSICHLALRIEV